MRVLAIDQGTTSTRILSLDGEGHATIVKSLRHEQTNPAEGWVEQDGEAILANILACLEAAGPADAIGIANQGESCLAWDAVTGAPLSPIITWQDNRTRDVTAGLDAAGHAEMVKAATGLPLDPYFSASKLGWLMAGNEAVRRAHADGRLRLGTTDAFYLSRLTGRFVTDVSTASRTSLMNIATGTWDPALCALFGVPIECLPEILPNVGDYGRWRSVPVTAGIVDQQAALYGHGCRKPGDAKITFGTGAFCLIVTDGLASAMSARGGLLPTVAWNLGEGIAFALDGGVYDAGSAVEWALEAGLADSVEALAGFDQPPAIERDLVFVPALSGLACPFWDRTASPVMIGMGPKTTRSDMTQALLEGIALLTVEIVDLAAADLALSDRISVDGGLTRSPYFCRFLADSLGRDIVLPAFDELTALGTALLAARGAGLSVPAMPGGAETVYKARPVDRAARLARFRQAIGLSRGWRQPG